LGELHNQGGTTEVVGTVAYVPQQPFIVNATLRDNILFGTPYDASRYQSAVVACQMEDDLKLLPFGDLTEIGERGINLSMGQKMRVALARAVYYDADIYLIDDALAAVDVHVGKQIFERVFIGLLAHKTRIVVTNQLHNLDHAAEVLVLEAGRVAERGTLAELMAKGLAFSDLVERHTAPTASTEPHDDNTNTNIDIDIDDEANAVTKRRSRVWSDDFDDQAVELLATQRASGQRVSGERASGVRKNSTEGGTVAMQPKGLGHAASSVLMTTEEKGKGRIALLNWLDYFAAQVIQKQAPPQSRP
jgi:ABC-type sulfate/molybdate transport systems ATPase subunit